VSGSTPNVRRGAFHGPTPPMRFGVILVTNPGGGSGMFGNTTSGPMYVYASRWRTSAAPPSVTRAVPYTMRYSQVVRLAVNAPNRTHDIVTASPNCSADTQVTFDASLRPGRSSNAAQH
jgi:hypothetical protein